MAHEFDGKKYEQASAHQKEWGGSMIAQLDLNGTERVLDLGCGDGLLTAQLVERLPQGEVVGLLRDLPAHQSGRHEIEQSGPRPARSRRGAIHRARIPALTKALSLRICRVNLRPLFFNDLREMAMAATSRSNRGLRSNRPTTAAVRAVFCYAWGQWFGCIAGTKLGL